VPSTDQANQNVNEDRLIELESRLIEQEHRITHIVYNFSFQKKMFPNPNDPRRLACSRAVIWRIFSAPTTFLAGSGIIGGLTLGILLWQTFLQRENNQLLQRQLQPNVEIYASSSSDKFNAHSMEFEFMIFNPGTEPCYIETGQWVADGKDIGHGHGVIRPVGNRVVPSKTMELIRLIIDDDIDLSEVINGSYVVPSEQLERLGADYLVGIEFDVIARIPTTQKMAGKFKCVLRKFAWFDSQTIISRIEPKIPLRLQVSEAFIPPDPSKYR